MRFELLDGVVVDSSRDCSFEERNLLQKMIIHLHLGLGREEFRARWLGQAQRVWGAEPDLTRPSPAMRVLLDMEKRLSDA